MTHVVRMWILIFALETRKLRERGLLVQYHAASEGEGCGANLSLDHSLCLFHHTIFCGCNWDTLPSPNPSLTLDDEETAMIQESSAPYHRALQVTAFGCQEQWPDDTTAWCNGCGRARLLSYLLLRIIKAEALSLSIIVLGWFNFKCGEQVYKQTNKKQKNKKCNMWLLGSTKPNQLHSEHTWKEIQSLTRGEHEKMNALFVWNQPESLLSVSIHCTTAYKN